MLQSVIFRFRFHLCAAKVSVHIWVTDNVLGHSSYMYPWVLFACNCCMRYASVTRLDIAMRWAATRKTRSTVYPYLELLFPLQSGNESTVAITCSIDTIHFRGCETFPPTMRMCDTIIAAVVKRRVNGFPCHFTSVERCGSSWNRE